MPPRAATITRSARSGLPRNKKLPGACPGSFIQSTFIPSVPSPRDFAEKGRVRAAQAEARRRRGTYFIAHLKASWNLRASKSSVASVMSPPSFVLERYSVFIQATSKIA